MKLMFCFIFLYFSFSNFCISSSLQDEERELNDDHVSLSINSHDFKFQKKMIAKGYKLLYMMSFGVPDQTHWTGWYKSYVSTYIERRKDFLKYSVILDILPHVSPTKIWYDIFGSSQNSRQKGDMQQETFHDDYLTAIISVSWALKDLGDEQGDVFQRGSYKVLSRNNNLIQFYQNYIYLCHGASSHDDFEQSQTTSTRGYQRRPVLQTSHYKDHMQYGIDVRFSESLSLFKLLPYGHTHILFGDLGFKESTEYHAFFLKFEDVGIGRISETLLHSCHFIQPVTDESQCRREKDIHDKLKPFIPFESKEKWSFNLWNDSSRSVNLGDFCEMAKDRNDFDLAWSQVYPHDQEDMRPHRTGNESLILL
jgi:hypothetical protein